MKTKHILLAGAALLGLVSCGDIQNPAFQALTSDVQVQPRLGVTSAGQTEVIQGMNKNDRAAALGRAYWGGAR